MTDEEREIVCMLSEVWDRFCALSIEHSMVQAEFCSGIHVLQRQVAARPAFRAMNATSVDGLKAVVDALARK